MAITTKEDRIEFRVSHKTKKTLEDAANLANLSLSSYIVSICLKQAKMDLESNETITLNNDERDRLLEFLSKPPKANKKLHDLLKK